ncbi:ZIP family metal transporter [Neolewinella lacunae]|uniref:ZIP family metal transporter n=1 Tax=Neolewinella lacunae TaxID=1517758 RepID=A0A923PK28_9BACT|nr:ZIP family metal transporter [Neolewinella lacunae]MBC6994010.1 ZIP family metal transporter [Neolewinella lacunae]MDN3634680.1 ZIP family metal transporter [Neolewinella lacunae]
MALWQYALLFTCVLFGGGLAQVMRGRTESAHWRRYLPLLLSFSGAYLLGIAAMEMMPTVFRNPQYHTGVWLLAGFFIQLLLEGLSQGIEHGHVHAHEHGNFRFALTVMVGLGLHAFLEGMPLGTAPEPGESLAAHTAMDAEHLLVGIILHKIPAAFALGLLLRYSGFSKAFTWVCLLVFASLSPLGAVFGEAISIDPVWRNRVLALVVGSFLHISTTILFEADGRKEHGITVRKFVVVIAGMLVAYFTAH